MPQPTAARPGWYRDSQSSLPLLRYWDGTRWTNQTELPAGAASSPAAPAAAAPTPSATPNRPKWWQAVKWGAVAGFLLASAVVVVALLNHQVVCSVNPKGEIAFAGKDGQCVQKQELAQSQQTLTNDVSAPKAEAAAASVPYSLPDLNGQWRAVGGITYLITQGGDQATIEEYTPGLGLTATGIGNVTDQGAQFRFTAYDGSSGTATYALQDANTLSGVVTNNNVGTQIPVVLRRVG